MIDEKEEKKNLDAHGVRVTKKYGKERMKVIFDFLFKLNRLYGFPYHDKTLFESSEDLESFNKRDLFDCFRILDRTKFYGAIKYSDIKTALNEARGLRMKFEKMDQIEPIKPGCPMPDNIKQHLSKSIGYKIEVTNG